jgi:succinate dehydrogenase / fumarate reductase cytochrome b subunit
MKWLGRMFLSSLGMKLIMALSGLFLSVFLMVHLAGNLQLLKDDGGQAFNLYAAFMGSNPFIQALSKVNFLIILLHVSLALILAQKNRNARGEVAYKFKVNKSSEWESRNMLLLGTIIFCFIVIHLRHFWMETHNGSIAMVSYDGKLVPDLYAVVIYWFSKAWYVSFYVVGMVGLSLHIWHGMPSAPRSIGISHLKYNLGIEMLGKSVAVIVPSLFAIIPIAMYVKTL